MYQVCKFEKSKLEIGTGLLLNSKYTVILRLCLCQPYYKLCINQLHCANYCQNAPILYNGKTEDIPIKYLSNYYYESCDLKDNILTIWLRDDNDYEIIKHYKK